jgi:hypothetical protein
MDNIEDVEEREVSLNKCEHCSEMKMDENLVSTDYKMAIQNSIKIMDGLYGGGFFVRYILDVGRMYGWLNLIIVYPDGLYKSIVSFKNILKETDVDSGNGVGHVDEKSAMKRNFDDPEGEYYVKFPQYETPSMVIPAQALWKRIRENYQSIPVVRINETETVMGIYKKMLEAAGENAAEYNSGFMDADGYVLMEKEAFENIILENGRIVSEVKTIFDVMGAFQKDKGTGGYQFSKKVNGERKRFYALKKELPLSKESPQSLADTKYCTSYKNQSELKIEKLRAENTRLSDKVNDLVMENHALKGGKGEVDDFEL